MVTNGYEGILHYTLALAVLPMLIQLGFYT